MNKTNVVYREVAEAVLVNRKTALVGREIAKRIGASPDTVSSALTPLKKIGAIAMYRRHFEVVNFKKLLLVWAVNRKFDRDISYRTYVEVKDIQEIEDRLPGEIAYTNYSGYVKLFGNDASSYGEVYVYASESAMKEIKIRFPPKNISKGSEYSNLIVLKPDGVLGKRIIDRELTNSSVSLPQLYVDLWTNGSWYAYEFLKKLEKRIDDAYANAILE